MYRIKSEHQASCGAEEAPRTYLKWKGLIQEHHFVGQHELGKPAAGWREVGQMSE